MEERGAALLLMDRYGSKDELLELFLEVLRAPSVNPPACTREVAEIIHQAFRREGITSELLEKEPEKTNVVARLVNSKRGSTVALNGHIDVVPPGEGWTCDPFEPAVLDNWVVARGASDMKSGAIAMAYSMILMARSGMNLSGNVLYTAVADEETGSSCGTRFLIESGVFENVEWAVVGEPTGLNVEHGNRGVIWMELVIEGVACHAGRSHVGQNPITIAAELIEVLSRDRFDVRNSEFEVPTPSLTVTRISAGIADNVVPQTCTMTLDRRLLPGENVARATDTIREAVRNTIGNRAKVHCSVKTAWEPYYLDPCHPLLAVACGSCERILGQKPEVRCKGGATDCSHLYHMAGIPSILLGPGEPEESHVVGEKVLFDKVVKSVDIYADIVRQLLGGEEIE
jgi:acetylornithine deacetylase/succinyl-diaminopimelate desuccinylase family protein